MKQQQQEEDEKKQKQQQQLVNNEDANTHEQNNPAVTSRKFLNFVEHLIVEKARNNDSPVSSPESSLVKDTLPSPENVCRVGRYQ